MRIAGAAERLDAKCTLPAADAEPREKPLDAFDLIFAYTPVGLGELREHGADRGQEHRLVAAGDPAVVAFSGHLLGKWIDLALQPIAGDSADNCTERPHPSAYRGTCYYPNEPHRITSFQEARLYEKNPSGSIDSGTLHGV